MGVCTNLYECFTTKPPLVIFASSLAAFALALLGICFYLETQTHILNPNVKDWNEFYEVLSNLKVCIPNHSETDNQSKLSVISPINNALDIQGNNTKNNITRSVILDLHFTELKPKEFMGLSFHGQILAEHLQHKRDMNLLDITITFLKPNENKVQPCVTFHGPSYLLPDAPEKESPEECLMQNNTGNIVQQVEIVNLQMMEKDWCKDRKQTGIRISANKAQYVYLTKGDVTIIQIHILYTTCLLFFMICILGLYAICGRRCSFAKSKILASPADKIQLIA